MVGNSNPEKHIKKTRKSAGNRIKKRGRERPSEDSAKQEQDVTSGAGKDKNSETELDFEMFARSAQESL